MKMPRLRKVLFAGIWLLGLLLIPLAAALALVIWRPTDVVVRLVNRLEPQFRFTADSIRWTSISSIRIEKAQFGQALKVPRIRVHWEWRKLWNRHLEMVKLEQAEVFLDLGNLANLEEQSRTKDSHGNPVSPSMSQRTCWHLEKLLVERGGLVMVGLGAGVPPLALEIEGEYDDVPFGGQLSEADLQKPRTIKFRNIHIHSPMDLAVTLLKIENVVLDFHYAGLRAHELDSLFFKRPILQVDRQLFWFVEELRASRAERAPAASSGPAWKTHLFQIKEGELEISRFREIGMQFPFILEGTQKDMNLKNLSLADFAIPIFIPNQNMTWDAKQLSFHNVRGKIAFNLGDSQTRTNAVDAIAPHANNLVNTVYVDTIHWKELEVTEGWLAMTFSPRGIDSQFGGVFAGGYLDGGVSCGWSSHDPWRTWGAAADVDTGLISTQLGYESFAIDGHAQLWFDLQGHEASLQGTMKLNSLTPGTLQIRSLDRVLERIQKNTEGLKRELLQPIVQGLRDYPYKQYNLDVQYLRPNATLTFRSESERGSRKMDLRWHGQENKE